MVLAGGDPLFYGVARYLCDKLGKDRFEVIPHVSTMQLAFARVKESWEEAFLTNLAGHSLGTVLENVRGAKRSACLPAIHAARRAWLNRCWMRGSITLRATSARTWGRPTNASRVANSTSLPPATTVV